MFVVQVLKIHKVIKILVFKFALKRLCIDDVVSSGVHKGEKKYDFVSPSKSKPYC